METPTPTPEQRPPTTDERLATIKSQFDTMNMRVNDMDAKLSIILRETEKASKARQITFWLTVIFFLLPLVGILLMIPTLMGQLNSMMSI